VQQNIQLDVNSVARNRSAQWHMNQSPVMGNKLTLFTVPSIICSCHKPPCVTRVDCEYGRTCWEYLHAVE